MVSSVQKPGCQKSLWGKMHDMTELYGIAGGPSAPQVLPV